MNIFVTKIAREDIINIQNFIKEGSPGYADIFVGKIIDKIENLSFMPKKGRVVPEFQLESIREIIFQSYRIVYRLEDSQITVLSVLHGAKLLKDSILQRD